MEELGQAQRVSLRRLTALLAPTRFQTVACSIFLPFRAPEHLVWCGNPMGLVILFQARSRFLLFPTLRTGPPGRSIRQTRSPFGTLVLTQCSLQTRQRGHSQLGVSSGLSFHLSLHSAVSLKAGPRRFFLGSLSQFHLVRS